MAPAYKSLTIDGVTLLASTRTGTYYFVIIADGCLLYDSTSPHTPIATWAYTGTGVQAFVGLSATSGATVPDSSYEVGSTVNLTSQLTLYSVGATAYKTNSYELTKIANAIRTKGGTSAQLTYPSGFVSAINAL